VAPSITLVSTRIFRCSEGMEDPDGRRYTAPVWSTGGRCGGVSWVGKRRCKLLNGRMDLFKGQTRKD
jgi:hypothetical protein